jgi:putative oxidoreductase
VPTRLFEPETAPRRNVQAPRPAPAGFADRIIETTPEVHLTLCRLVLGGVMAVHAAQKLPGWFGGEGLTDTVAAFEMHLGLPMIVGVLVVLAEVAGSVGLILGAFGRVAAGCIVTVMVGAILLVHQQNGFFMNWTGKNPGEGFEYHLLAIGLAIPILARGSGAASVDLWWRRRMRPAP